MSASVRPCPTPICKTSYTSQIGVSMSEQAMHCWCHGTQAMDNTICYCLVFHEHGKQYFVQPLPEVNSTTVHDLYSLWVACLCSLIPRPLPDFSPRLHDKIWEWPGKEATALVCLLWSAVAKRVLTWVIFVPRASHQHSTLTNSPSPTQRWAGHCRISHAQMHARNYLSRLRTFGLHRNI